MIGIWATSFRIFLFMTVLTGLIYPLLVTVVGQVGLSRQANGSLIRQAEKVIGSELIGQKFEKPNHFWGRPSAVDYNPLPSGASNLGPTSQDLRSKIEERKKGGATGDLLFASGSGLDPHISPESALNQVPRVVAALNLSNEQEAMITQRVIALIEANIEGRQYSILGESRVNVLKLNQALNLMRE